MKYRVKATIRGNRKTTDKYWLKKKNAQKYANDTNKHYNKANARVIKCR